MVAQIHHPPYTLHPSVKDSLHKEYVDFYNKYLINNPPVHHLPLSVGRGGGQYIVCHSKPLSVGNTQDVSIHRRKTFGPDIRIRCFTPPGTPPRPGWPLVIYHHGGGWVFGDINSENTICTNMCIRANAVVITTDYRLASFLPTQSTTTGSRIQDSPGILKSQYISLHTLSLADFLI